MDNLSRAILIAGGILISILVIGLAVVLITKFGGFSADMNNRLAENKKAEFNDQFYKLSERVDVTADEIATIINMAKEQNDQNEIDLTNAMGSQYYTNVIIKTGESQYTGQKGKSFFKAIGTQNISKDGFKTKINEFLETYNDYYFCCNAKVLDVDDSEHNANPDDPIKIKAAIDNRGDLDSDNLGYIRCIRFTIVNDSLASGAYSKGYKVSNQPNCKINFN